MPGATSSISRSKTSTCSRYGNESENVALDKLGGEGWQRRKARMRERILEMAGQLMATAAMRALRQADAGGRSGQLWPLRRSLPWTRPRTRTRHRRCPADMAEGKPMDRLVCGDVGFGKTEVALRAAFVAAMAGHQVAVIAPTTLLARQHYANFVERFAGFPSRSAASRAWLRPRRQRRPAPAWPMARWTLSWAPMPCCRNRSSSSAWAWSSSTRNSALA
jgi:transcription-repair coupling factor (superfamily II helicase)